MQARREKANDDGGHGDSFLECESCKRRMSRAERATLACGFVDSIEWVKGMRPYPDATVCPGYSTRLPEVVETSRALLWARRGELRLFFEPHQVTPLAKDCIDLLDSACNGAEREMLREQREDMRRKNGS